MIVKPSPRHIAFRLVYWHSLESMNNFTGIRSILGIWEIPECCIEAGIELDHGA